MPTTPSTSNLVIAPTQAMLDRAKSYLPERGWKFQIVPGGGIYQTAEFVLNLTEREAGGVELHGPREWAADGGLDGVFADHQDRYKWAASMLRAGDRVVDAPCGTGYGSVFLATLPGVTYHGVDIERSAVEAAVQQYRMARGGFVEGSMLDIPMGSEHVDVVVSFEGFEHVEDHVQVMAEFYRVLKSGGRLIMSTPVRGVAPGTAWDKYMVTPDEFVAYVAGAGFVDIERFYQENYGAPCSVKPGVPRGTDLIQLLTAVKL